MIVNMNDKAKDLYYNNVKSGLKATNSQDAIDEVSGKVDQIAGNQIPEEYLEAAVDEYVNNNSGGFATKVELEGLDNQFSSEIVEVNSDVHSITDGGFLSIGFDYIEGGYIDTTTGEVVAYDGWKYTDYLDISKRENGLISLTTDGQKSAYNVFFDENKEFLFNRTENGVMDESSIYSNAKYVRLSCKADSNQSLKIYQSGYASRAELAERTTDLLDKNSNIFNAEIEDAITKVLSYSEEPCLIIPMISDTHYDSADENNVKRTLDTFKNVKSVLKRITHDGLVHLGDMLTFKSTCDTQDAVNGDLNYIVSLMKECSDKVFFTQGNHDGLNGGVPQTRNYCTLGKVNSQYVIRESNNPYYYYDYENLKIRCIFLATDDFVDGSNIRGISDNQLSWIAETLENTENDYSVIVFSHIGTFDTKDFTRNRANVIEVFNDFHNHTGVFQSKTGKVIGWFTGHEHLDCVLPKEASGLDFPQVTMQCSLLGGWTPTEDYSYIYPYDWVVHDRVDNTVSQDCWDIMIYRPIENKINIVRFGAGNDREINLSTWN